MPAARYSEELKAQVVREVTGEGTHHLLGRLVV